eukprot:PhM_4_TR2135/c0_g1_i1/m.54172
MDSVDMSGRLYARSERYASPQRNRDPEFILPYEDTTMAAEIRRQGYPPARPPPVPTMYHCPCCDGLNPDHRHGRHSTAFSRLEHDPLYNVIEERAKYVPRTASRSPASRRGVGSQMPRPSRQLEPLVRSTSLMSREDQLAFARHAQRSPAPPSISEIRALERKKKNARLSNGGSGSQLMRQELLLTIHRASDLLPNEKGTCEPYVVIRKGPGFEAYTSVRGNANAVWEEQMSIPLTNDHPLELGVYDTKRGGGYEFIGGHLFTAANLSALAGTQVVQLFPRMNESDPELVRKQNHLGQLTISWEIVLTPQPDVTTSQSMQQQQQSQGTPSVPAQTSGSRHSSPARPNPNDRVEVALSFFYASSLPATDGQYYLKVVTEDLEGVTSAVPCVHSVAEWQEELKFSTTRGSRLPLFLMSTEDEDRPVSGVVLELELMPEQGEIEISLAEGVTDNLYPTNKPLYPTGLIMLGWNISKQTTPSKDYTQESQAEQAPAEPEKLSILVSRGVDINSCASCYVVVRHNGFEGRTLAQRAPYPNFDQEVVFAAADHHQPIEVFVLDDVSGAVIGVGALQFERGTEGDKVVNLHPEDVGGSPARHQQTVGQILLFWRHTDPTLGGDSENVGHRTSPRGFVASSDLEQPLSSDSFHRTDEGHHAAAEGTSIVDRQLYSGGGDAEKTGEESSGASGGRGGQSQTQGFAFAQQEPDEDIHGKTKTYVDPEDKDPHHGGAQSTAGVNDVADAEQDLLGDEHHEGGTHKDNDDYNRRAELISDERERLAMLQEQQEKEDNAERQKQLQQQQQQQGHQQHQQEQHNHTDAAEHTVPTPQRVAPIPTLVRGDSNDEGVDDDGTPVPRRPPTPTGAADVTNTAATLHRHPQTDQQLSSENRGHASTRSLGAESGVSTGGLTHSERTGGSGTSTMMGRRDPRYDDNPATDVHSSYSPDTDDHKSKRKNDDNVAVADDAFTAEEFAQQLKEREAALHKEHSRDADELRSCIGTLRGEIEAMQSNKSTTEEQLRAMVAELRMNEAKLSRVIEEHAKENRKLKEESDAFLAAQQKERDERLSRAQQNEEERSTLTFENEQLRRNLEDEIVAKSKLEEELYALKKHVLEMRGKELQQNIRASSQPSSPRMPPKATTEDGNAATPAGGSYFSAPPLQPHERTITPTNNNISQNNSSGINLPPSASALALNQSPRGSTTPRNVSITPSAYQNGNQLTPYRRSNTEMSARTGSPRHGTTSVMSLAPTETKPRHDLIGQPWHPPSSKPNIFPEQYASNIEILANRRRQTPYSRLNSFQGTGNPSPMPIMQRSMSSGSSRRPASRTTTTTTAAGADSSTLAIAAPPKIVRSNSSMSGRY